MGNMQVVSPGTRVSQRKTAFFIRDRTGPGLRGTRYEELQGGSRNTFARFVHDRAGKTAKVDNMV